MTTPTPKPHRHQSFPTTLSKEHIVIGLNRQGSAPNTSTKQLPLTSDLETSSQKNPICNPSVKPYLSLGDPGLTRHGTLLTANATPARAAAELKSILGNHNARLKSKAALVRVDSGSAAFNRHVTLEQAKSRARVEVDILPQSPICVQGGHLRGHIKVSIRKATAKETPIFIAGGKIRVIGFESVGDKSKSVFYQCLAMLASVTPSLDGLYASNRDVEGFAQAKEGDHQFPFALYLTLSNDKGQAKGSLKSHPGFGLNYIAMVSFKIKDEPGRRSIAHFYRLIEVWPRLDPAAILSPAIRPLQATVSTNISKLPHTGRIKLTASIHRLHWVAGQLCQVKIIIDNNTTKTLKKLTLGIHRTTTIFPHSSCSSVDRDHDSSQHTLSTNQVAESTLEAGQPGTKGHASAKGWWLGVRPNQYLEFEHSILIPLDALTVVRGRFFEIEYSLRVAINSGTRLASHVQVMLPIRIISFLSIDPPPSQPSAQTPLGFRPPASRQISRATEASGYFPRASGASCDIYPCESNALDEPFSDYDDELGNIELGNLSLTDDSNSCDIYPYESNALDEPFSDYDDELGNIELGNLSLTNDSDDVVQRAITTARVESTYFGFSDLYYSEDRDIKLENTGNAQDYPNDQFIEEVVRDSVTGTLETLMEEVAIENESSADIYGGESATLRPSLGVRKRPSFTERVEEKTRLANATFLNGDRDPQAHQEQEEVVSNSTKAGRRSGRPHLSLTIPPALGGEDLQCCRPPSAAKFHSAEEVSITAQELYGESYEAPVTSGRSEWSSGKNSGSGPKKKCVSVPLTTLSNDSSAQSLTMLSIHEEERQDPMTAISTLLGSHCDKKIAHYGADEDGASPVSVARRMTPTKAVSDFSTDPDTSLPRVRSSLSGWQAPVTGLGALSPTSVISTSSITSAGCISVKDKVRQLEERVKASST
ncbi:hypothetical protein AN958_06659 [Leucoagaricus sp. SymC.cos]|nr:hypothetical protein AN958_06659 [Leucoagaricus sp. SymC.cos]